MPEGLRLMCVLAHPDDESLGTGALLAWCAVQGIQTYLVTATRGERGWAGIPSANPGLEGLGRIREAELRAAARVLGIHEVSFLDYMDGDLDRAEPAEAIGKVAGHLRRVRPQVVVTFGPDGAYGHPDHIAISQLTFAAAVCAADPAFAVPAARDRPHRVSKLYYMVDERSVVDEFSHILGALAIEVEGVVRRTIAWEDWTVTTRIDASAHLDTVLQAIFCHESQLPGYEPLRTMPADETARLLGIQTLYRAYSTVNGGRRVERDVFEGLR